MKKNKFKDLFITLALVSSLALAGFFVSCSEDGNIFGPNSNGLGTTNSTEDTESSAISTMFENIAAGAENQVGADILGWVLGAMGIAGSSGPNYEQEIAKISAQLDSIITLLGDVDNELVQINHTLQVINCSEQTSSLQTEIGEIRELFNQYNGMLSVANAGDTLPDSTMRSWSDKVLGNTPGWTDIGEQLSTIETNLESNTGAIYACVTALNLPSGTGLYGDTSYYNNVDAITNSYYYWQSLALLLISEANHYYAWVEAGRPGGSTISADSVQAVCDANGSALLFCNDVGIETNQLYNSLITQMTYGGTQYTDDYLIFDNSYTNPKAWVRSLEDFTSQAGYNCSSPLTNDSPCGPTAVYYSDTLSERIYRGTTGFQFANYTELDSLVNGDSVHNKNMTAGEYLQYKGFMNMSNKTFIATNISTVYIGPLVPGGGTVNFVPFFNTDAPAINTSYGYKSVIYGEGFNAFLNPDVNNYVECLSGSMPTFGTEVKYSGSYDGISNIDQFLKTWAYSFSCLSSSIPFHFTDSLYNPQHAGYPGPSQYFPLYYQTAQDNKTVPKRYRMVMTETKNTVCTNGRSNVNVGGMQTPCGDDFTAFLNVNVPRPGTCDDKTLNTPCIILQ